MGGVLLKGALTNAEQQWLYREMCALAHGSEEPEILRSTASVPEARRRPQQFVTWLHPYTRLSTAYRRPTQLLQWAQTLLHTLVAESRTHVVDSMLAQMYFAGGSLLPHCDEDLSWGLGVSLGGEAQFECLPSGDGEQPCKVHVRSGDVLIGEFGKMRHAVRVPRNSVTPCWWDGVDNFERTRCNVLFRQALTLEEQQGLAEQRAVSVYKMSLAQLQKETGKDLSYLSAHLRHASVE